MFDLHDTDSGVLLGSVTTEQLQLLLELLEEESLEDRDYHISADTLDYFARQEADPALINLLQGALGAREGMEIRWTRAG